MSKAGKDPVRELLRRQSNELASKAIGSEGLSDEDIAGLGRLARLIEIREAAAPPRRNWWAAGVLACTLAIVSALLFVRVPETDVELELTISGVRFTLASDQLIAGAMRVAQVGVSGLRQVQLPMDAEADAGAGQSFTDHSAIRVSVNGTAKSPGVATLAPLLLSTGSSVGLRSVGGPYEYALDRKSTRLNSSHL